MKKYIRHNKIKGKKHNIVVVVVVIKANSLYGVINSFFLLYFLSINAMQINHQSN